MTNDNSANAIAIENVHKAFGPTKALNGATFHVRRGESHALLGRNGAGKSTLISVLTGLVVPDTGLVELRGDDSGPVEAPGSDSIACVYQKSTLVPGLTAAENISLGAYPTKSLGAVDWRAMRERGSGLLDEWGFARIIDRRVEDLEPLERKVVEVCRAMSRGPRILLLDEPTAGLDDGACNELFDQINQARARGVTVVYVSHHLDEIFKVCDAVTILRDGRDVEHTVIGDTSVEQIVSVLAGDGAGKVAEEVAELSTTDLDRQHGDVALQAHEISVGDSIQAFDLEIRAGESVGLTGLDGAGHIQAAQALVGQLKTSTGTIDVNGHAVRPGSIRSAIDAGIGFVPEDRHHSGFAPELSVEENATMTVLDKIRNAAGFVSKTSRRKRYNTLSQTWTIKASSPGQAVQERSGGNQQKVVLARALASDPKVLILIHPTAGVDVTAKESIYRSLRKLQRDGCAVLVVSSDDDDLEICDRVLVMFKGQLHTELPHPWTERDLVAAVQGSTVATA
jgi:simple sugar transport system ATP-binding protein